MKTQRIAVAAAALCGLLGALAMPAFSLTGDEVLNKMEPRESGGYLAGTVEMAAFLTNLEGNKARSDCIMDWYYEKDGIEQIVTMLDQYKDRQALPVIHVMIRRACGE